MRQILLLLLCFSSFWGFSQQFGGNPPSLKWSQINTDTARIIFPKGLDSLASYVANFVHHLAANDSSLGQRLKKINIILQNQTTIANGYVGLGPYRSEFFLTPSPNNFELGSIYWPQALALHEYRHVQQFNNFTIGFSKIMYYLFGEDGLALAINASVPDWFYEGDAVHSETIHSKQGRGRIPFFLNQYKSLWLAGKDYSWMKLRNGSLKHFVPSHYQLGYLLVKYGYEKYGDEFWQKVTRDAAAFRGLLYPFQRAIKEHAGVDFKTFRTNAFDHYRARFSVGETKTDPSSQPFYSETFPFQAGKDSLVFLKSDYRNVPAFFVSTNGARRKLRTRDISLEDQFSYRNGKIVYSAYKPHSRWGWKDHSQLRVLDVSSGRQTTVGKATKYFTPDISPGGQTIIAVHADPRGKSELHLLNTSGEILNKLQSSEIQVFTDPRFITDSLVATAVRLNNGKMALALADLGTGAIERLTPPTFSVLGFLSYDNEKIYYTAGYQGNDDLYAVDIQSRKIFRVSHDSLGNYFVNAGNGKLIYSKFTADGYRLQELQIHDLRLEEVRPSDTASANNRVEIFPGREFVSSSYSKASRLFNLHSWRPNYEDPEFSFTIYGENVLNTFQTELYYLYNRNENTNAAGMNVAYGGIFPVLTAGAEMTFDLRDTLNNLTRRWNHLDSRIGFNIPLNFSGGRFFRFLNFGSTHVWRNEYNIGQTKNFFAETNFNYLSHFISFSQQFQRARQHIFPRLGFNVLSRHRHTITGFDAYQFFGNGSVYLPGLLPVHNLVLSGAFQQRDTLRAVFAGSMANARGYSDYYRTNAGSRMWRVSANYHLPLLLPDWGFGNLFYLQRVRANLFYDFQRLYSDNKKLTADLRSTGAEIYLDTKWWNQHPLSFGIRLNYLLDDDPRGGRASGSSWIEFILPVSIIPR